MICRYRHADSRTTPIVPCVALAADLAAVIERLRLRASWWRLNTELGRLHHVTVQGDVGVVVHTTWCP
jgi:hypothetical protein